MNHIINIANTVQGNPIYRLEPDDWGDYLPAEHAWHHGELELILRRPSTAVLAEILADFLENDMLDISETNSILEDDMCSFWFEKHDDGVHLIVEKLSDIPDDRLVGDHPNIRKLAERMDNAIKTDDPAAALHAAASVFETLAKDVLADTKIEDQSLGGFFEKYRKNSLLPKAVLDYMLDVFKERNTTPLAGHGSTKLPKITIEQAITLVEMTKSIVRMERQLAHVETTSGDQSTESKTKSK